MNNTITSINRLRIHSFVNITDPLPYARLILVQELIRSLVQVLPCHLNIALSGFDFRMPNELLSFENVLSRIVELSCLCHSKVVALNFKVMLIEELSNHLRPLVCWVTTSTWWEDDVRVICAYFNLISSDCSNRDFINNNCACACFLAC